MPEAIPLFFLAGNLYLQPTAGQILNFEVVLNVILYVIRSTFIERNLIFGLIESFVVRGD